MQTKMWVTITNPEKPNIGRYGIDLLKPTSESWNVFALFTSLRRQATQLGKWLKNPIVFSHLPEKPNSQEWVKKLALLYLCQNQNKLESINQTEGDINTE